MAEGNAGGADDVARAFAEHEHETVALAAELLSVELGGSIDLAQVKSFRGPSSRATVLRCAVTGPDEPTGPTSAPESVIVKRFRQEGGGPYDASETSRGSPRGRLVSEWSGLRFVHAREESRVFAPKPLAADVREGLVVLEDLGEGECLADVLQANDPAAAEAALVAYAATLGRLHAATAGQRDAHERVRAEAAGDPPVDADSPTGGLLDRALPALRKSFAEMDVSLSSRCEAELEEVADLTARPGPFDAFSVSDTCPDNHRYTRGSAASGDGAGYLRFFDLEFSTFRHALIDASYVWLPFPTCWCVNRLPDGMPERLTQVYRQALVEGCPAAADDALFGRGLAAASIYWLVSTFGWNLASALREDGKWGISTVRQRHPLRAQNVAALCERQGAFPAVAQLARDVAARLRERWGAESEMPLYPAFRAA